VSLPKLRAVEEHCKTIMFKQEIRHLYTRLLESSRKIIAASVL